MNPLDVAAARRRRITLEGQRRHQPDCKVTAERRARARANGYFGPLTRGEM